MSRVALRFKLVLQLPVLMLLATNGAAQENMWWKNTIRLHDELLIKRNYSASVNPQPNVNHTTVVGIHMAVRGISLDDRTQVMQLNCWAMMYWKDPRLTWDNKDFGALKVTEFGQDELWRPDLHVYNNAEPTEVNHYGSIPMLVFDSGTVLWVPPMTTKSECPMDLTWWPFDTQTCWLYLGSWTTHGLQIDFLPMNANASTEEFLSSMIKTSHHWSVQSFKLRRLVNFYECCPEPYIAVEVEVQLTRTSPFFQSTIVIPAVAVGLLMLVQFVLPVDYPPRVTVGVANALLTLLMTITISIELPPLGESCPIVVKYFSLVLLMTVISVAVSGIIARLASKDPDIIATPPPALLKNVFTGPLATVLCLQSFAGKIGHSAGDKSDEQETLDGRPNYTHEWLFVATAVERVLAITYVVIFVVAAVGMIAPLH